MFDDTVPSQRALDMETPDVRAIPPRHKSAVRRTRRVNLTVLPITGIRPAGEMRLRADRDGVPGVAARAAVAADHDRNGNSRLAVLFQIGVPVETILVELEQPP